MIRDTVHNRRRTGKKGEENCVLGDRGKIQQVRLRGQHLVRGWQGGVQEGGLKENKGRRKPNWEAVPKVDLLYYIQIMKASEKGNQRENTSQATERAREHEDKVESAFPRNDLKKN